MSLRLFHILFVALSTAMALFTGVWGFWLARSFGDSRGLLVGLVGLLGVVWLPWYGVRVWSKLFGGGQNVP